MVEDGLAGSDLWESAKCFSHSCSTRLLHTLIILVRRADGRRFHFESIAHDNASLHSTILTPCPPSPISSTPLSFSNPISLPTPRPIILSGTQRIHKFSHDPSGAPRPGQDTDLPDEVWIGVALWRCWLEDPSAGVSKKADLVCSVNVNLSAEGGNDEGRRVEEWWTRTVGTLRILDWELFGDTS